MKSRRPHEVIATTACGPLAVGPVDPLPALVVPAAEQLGQMQVLEVVRLVEARDLGGEGVLEREVDDVDSGRLDRPVGAAHRVPGADCRDPLGECPCRSAGRGGGRIRCRGCRTRHGPAEVRAQPLLVLGVGEEEVLLIAVPSRESPDATPITTCSTPPKLPLPKPGVDADAQRAHPRPAIHADDMAASEPKVSIVIPNRDGATPREGLAYLDMVMGHARRAELPRLRRDGRRQRLDRRLGGAPARALARGEGGRARREPRLLRGGQPRHRRQPGPYVALLNTDLELSPDWLELLVGELDRDSRLGFATGKIMRLDDRGVIEQAGHDFFTCGRFEPRGLDERDEGQYDERRATPIVTAAAAMYRREALEAADGFDEDYFLYCEDGDVCLRMLLCGYSGALRAPSRRRSTSAAGRSARGLSLPRLLPGSERAGHPAQGHTGVGPAPLAAEDRPLSLGPAGLRAAGGIRRGRSCAPTGHSCGWSRRHAAQTACGLRRGGAGSRPATFAAELRTDYPFRHALSGHDVLVMETAVALILFRRPEQTARSSSGSAKRARKTCS